VSHFLIVDDDLAVAGTLTRMLELRGYRVSSAQGAEAGLEMATREPPDAILVDMRMPSMSGIEFLRHLRRNPRLQDLPVAIITGDYFLDQTQLGEIHALGATVRYKPLWLEDLSALAASLTGKTD
jgi:CheY-like chemotaxis protein